MLKAPFLRELRHGPAWPAPSQGRAEYPFTLPILQTEPVLQFDRAVTLLVGECGSGKSTLLEAIAGNAGFGTAGGSRHHGGVESADAVHGLHRALRFSWSIRPHTGFFLRAESFADLARYLDTHGADWGTGELHGQSHGESFLAVCRHRVPLSRRTLVLLDEPEAALSPRRQLDLLAQLLAWQRAGNVQVIAATHSPILMRCPGASLLSLDGGRIAPIRWEDTEHCRVTRAFLDAPDASLPDLIGER